MCHDLSLDITCYLYVPRFIFRYNMLSVGATIYLSVPLIICMFKALSSDRAFSLQVPCFILCSLGYTLYLQAPEFIFSLHMSVGAIVYLSTHVIDKGDTLYVLVPRVICRCRTSPLCTAVCICVSHLILASQRY